LLQWACRHGWKWFLQHFQWYLWLF